MIIEGKIKSVKLGIFPITLFIYPNYSLSNLLKIVIRDEEDLNMLRNGK